MPDRTLSASGENWYGKLGTGTYLHTAGQVGTDTDWYFAEAAMSNFSVGLKLDGSLWTWGYKMQNGTADSPDGKQLTPYRVGTGFDDVTLGDTVTAAVRPHPTNPTSGAGYLWMAGSNATGLFFDKPIGSGEPVIDELIPINPLDSQWDTVAAAPGNVMTGFHNYYRNTWSAGSAPVQEYTGAINEVRGYNANHTLAVGASGRLWGQGDNTYGQIGQSLLYNYYPTQQNVNGNLSPINYGWTYAATGCMTSAAIRYDTDLYTWGQNDAGQLGTGDNTYYYSPKFIMSNVKRVAVGCMITAILKTDGTFWISGIGIRGEFGNGAYGQYFKFTQTVPGTWNEIAIGKEYVLGIKTDGTLWAWGDNAFGKLGDGTTTRRLSPVQIGTDTTWVSVMAGVDHSGAMQSDGSLWLWGRADSGQIGNHEYSEPRPAQLLP